MTMTPLSWRISSASGVVGPLAASAMIRAWIGPAFSRVITFSRAAGTRMSHRQLQELVVGDASLPGSR